MAVPHAMALSVAALMLFSAVARAGPCADQIYDEDLAINKRLDAAAARGKPAPESGFATMHRQPTPLTVAGAEEKAGDLSEAEVKALAAFMDEARKADLAGDVAACKKALADADRMLNK
jgi:hypothetical protein